MLVPYFDRSNIDFVNCVHGVNGRLPTELTSTDLDEIISKVFTKDTILIAVISAHLLKQIECVHGFNSYRDYKSIQYGAITNEIGIYKNIRFVIDTHELRNPIVNLACPDGIIYHTYLFQSQLSEDNIFVTAKDKIVDIRSSLA